MRARSRPGREHRQRTLEVLERRLLLAPIGAGAYAPGTSDDYVAAFESRYLDPVPPGASGFQFDDSDRWSTTATDGGGLSQGDATTLTWSLPPDGTLTDDGTASNLIAFFDGLYGAGAGGSDYTQRPWFPIFEDSFARWSALSGITYVYEPNDDGASMSSSRPGIVGTRGDTRIFGKNIDGASGGTLAYNYFPNYGDMVLDTSESSWFGSESNASRYARNVIIEEVGHGLGFEHVLPLDGTKLLEPQATNSFDGPQFDDILAVHRGYGDVHEKAGGNDIAANATPLAAGTIAAGTTVTIGADGVDASVAPTDIDFVSIDDNSDTDFYSFTVATSKSIAATLTPIGPTYDQGQQCGDGSTSGNCLPPPDPTSFNASAQSDLTLRLIDTNGVSPLITANSGGLGQSETIAETDLPGGGTYYLRITGAQNAAQLYQLDLTIGDATGADTISPSVSQWTPADGSVIVPPSVDIDVQFSEAVTGVDATDMVLKGTAAASATAGNVIHLGGNQYRFPVTGLVDGDLQVTLAPDANDIEDLAGNDLAEATFSLTVFEGLAVTTTIEGINRDENAGNSLGFTFSQINPHGAAGPSHLVSVVYNSIEWHTKTGMQQHSQSLGDFQGNGFFGPLNPTDFVDDPHVIFDPFAERFVVLAANNDFDTDSSRLFLAVSDDDDPNSTWHFGEINSTVNVDGDDHYVSDVAIAVDEEAIYITADLFGFSSGFGGSRLWILDKGDGSGGLYDGGSIASNIYDPSSEISLSYDAFQFLPAQLQAPAPAGTGTILLSSAIGFSGGAEGLIVIRIDDPLGSPSFTDTRLNVGNISLGSPPNAPQRDSSVSLDTGFDGISSVAWHDDSLWAVETINPAAGVDSGQATVHWYRLDTSNLNSISLSAQGNVGGEDIGAGTHTFFPSVTVDSEGNVGFTFNASSADLYPSSYVTGWLQSSSSFEDSVDLAAGLDAYESFSGAWGNYSSVALDPADDLSFWAFNSYALERNSTAGRWGTRWGSFRLSTSSTPGVSLQVAPASVAENSGTPIEFTFSRDGATDNPLTVHFTIGGDAIYLDDYLQTGSGTFGGAGGQGTVQFATGADTAIVAISPIADEVDEPSESVTVQLNADASYSVATAGVMTGVINNDDATPIADAGGPYLIDEGDSLQLDGSGTTDADSGALTYQWDVDGNGNYNEGITGQQPVVSASQLAALGLGDGHLGPVVIRLLVSDGANPATATTTLTVRNVAPEAHAGGPYLLKTGYDAQFDASTSSDPGNDIVSYAWDLDNDGQYDDATGVAPTATWSQLTSLGIAWTGTHPVSVRVTDTDGAATAATTSLTIQPSTVTERLLFYNNSAFDAPNNDDAIAAKTALLPPGNATFDNYSSYIRGINGLFVDLDRLADRSLTAADFTFLVGNDNNPGGWSAAPNPAIQVHAAAGINGADRIEFIWNDGVIVNTWLQVTVHANVRTGLPSDDVFYFGSALGDTGDSTAQALTNGFDFSGVRSHASSNVGVSSTYDLNRDDYVDGADLAAARDHVSNFHAALQLIVVPGAAPPPVAESVVAQSLDDATIGSAEAAMPATTTKRSLLVEATALAEPQLVAGPARSTSASLESLLDLLAADVWQAENEN